MLSINDKKAPKTYLMKKFVRELAPSLWQLLNWQRVQRIFVLQKFEIKFGTWNVGSFCGRGTEVSEQLRKRKVDMCCLQEVRCRGQGARFVGIRGRRYKLWWSGNNDGIDVEILVKKELFIKVIKIQRKSDKVIIITLVFEEELIRIICAYASQVGRSECNKDQFYNDMASE